MMRAVKRALAALLCACVLLPCAPAGAQEAASTTVMIYMCGSNLESQYGMASADIEEMLSAGFDAERTTVLLMLGGAQRWDMGFDADSTSICEIGRRGLRVLEARERMNMGEAQTLSYFLNYACERCQSDRYVLIVWDHGGGPLGGVCWDENCTPDNLTMQELTDALAQSPFARRKLDMIGFDACLMGSLEVAWMVSPYAEYMTASEETEPGWGWNYSFLRDLERDASMEDTGRRIVDSYVESGDGKYNLTLSCLDLSRIARVESAMSDFFYGLQEGERKPSFTELSAARRASVDFGRDLRAYDSASYDIVDLRSLLESCRTYCPKPGDALEQAINSAVVYSRSNVEGSSGLSVYFPFYNAEMYRSSGEAKYASMNFCPGYTSYMRKFGDYLLGDATVSWAGIPTRVESGESGEEISAQLTPEQAEEMVSAQLVIFDTANLPGSDRMYFYQTYDTDEVELDGNNCLHARYDGEYLLFRMEAEGRYRYSRSVPFQILDTGEYVVEGLASNRDDASVWSASSIDTFDGENYGESQRVRLLFAPPDSEGKLELLRVYPYDSLTDRFTTRANFHLEDYRYLHILERSRVPVAGEDGALLPFDSWESEYKTYENVGLSPVCVELALNWTCMINNGQHLWYYAAFQITDNQNRCYLTDLAPLDDSYLMRVENRTELSDANLIEVEPQCIFSANMGLLFYVKVTNRSPIPLRCQLDVQSVNDIPYARNYADPSGFFYDEEEEMQPGQTVSMYAGFNGTDFGNDRILEFIGFAVSAYPNGTETPAEVVSGRQYVYVDISHAVGQEPSVWFEPDPLAWNSPALYEGAGVRLQLNTVMVTRDSVILAVTCENSGSETACLRATGGSLEGQDAQFRYWDSEDFGWSPEDFDAVEIPAGGSVETFFELLRAEGGPESVETAALQLGPESGPGEAVQIVLPERTAFGGERVRFAGEQVRVLRSR